MDYYRINIRDIQSCFDYCRRNKYINLLIYKFMHDIFQLTLTHLTMSKFHTCVRKKTSQLQRDPFDIIHSVINIINLAITCQLSCDSLFYDFLIVFHHIGLNRTSVHRRLLQKTHISDSDKTHMQSSRNRRCRKCQHINCIFQLFDRFLMLNAESLFLVNNKESQRLILNVL